MLINTVTPSSLWLELTQVFDFSVDSNYWDYTYWYTSWNWLTIQNANGWVTNWWSSWGNGSVYKEVNATEVWTRALINFNNTSISWNRGWGISLYSWTSWYDNWPSITAENWVQRISISRSGTENEKVTTTMTLGTDYYIDGKFKNWIYTATLLDTSENVLATTSLQTTDTEMKYIWFSMWNHSATPAFCRLKKFREWHR